MNLQTLGFKLCTTGRAHPTTKGAGADKTCRRHFATQGASSLPIDRQISRGLLQISKTSLLYLGRRWRIRRGDQAHPLGKEVAHSRCTLIDSLCLPGDFFATCTGGFPLKPEPKSPLSNAGRRIILSVVQIHTFGGCKPEDRARKYSRRA